MRIKEGFKMRTVGGYNVVVPEGTALLSFNKMLSLNETAAYLWGLVVGKDFTVDTLADLLVEKYGIDRELALRDAGTLATKWIESGFAEE